MNVKSVKLKLKYYSQKLIERPVTTFCLSIVLYFLQLWLWTVIPMRFIAMVICILMQFCAVALNSRALVFATDVCGFKKLVCLFMVYFITIVPVLVTVAYMAVLTFLGG